MYLNSDGILDVDLDLAGIDSGSDVKSLLSNPLPPKSPYVLYGWSLRYYRL